MFYFNVFLKADNLISIEIKNVNESVTINLLNRIPLFSKEGLGEIWQRLIQPHTQSALTFSKNK